MNAMKLVLSLACLICGRDEVEAPAPPPFVAIVGSEAITPYELQKRVEQMMRELEAKHALAVLEEQKAAIIRSVLEEMVNEQLILQEYHRLNDGKNGEAEIGREQVQAELEDRVKTLRERGYRDIRTVDDYLRFQRKTFDTPRAEVYDRAREDIKIRICLWENVFKDIDRSVPRKDSRQYYRTHLQEFSTPKEFAFRHIFFRADRVIAPVIIEEIQKGLEEKVSFVELARQFSQDSDRVEVRGELKRKTFEDLQDWPPPILQTLQQMRPGEARGPFRSERGLHYLKLEERVSGEPKSYEDALPVIQEKILAQRRREKYSAFLSELRRRRHVEIHLKSWLENGMKGAGVDRESRHDRGSRVQRVKGTTDEGARERDTKPKVERAGKLHDDIVAAFPGGSPTVEGFTRLRPNEFGYPEYRHEATGMVFVLLPGGTFQMGATADEHREASFDEEDELPRHEVRVSPFLIAKYEVTQDVWEKAMGSNPSRFKNAGKDAPVERVSWEECQSFCKKFGLKLPTEAQWEYACRAGSSGATYTGALRLRGKRNAPGLDAIAWYGGNSGVSYEGGYDSSGWKEKQYPHTRAGTHPVGGKKANGFGLYDMLGNVWEWCEDVYDEDYYSSAAARDGDKARTAGSGFRVFRGGSWYSLAWFCRSAFRPWLVPSYRRSHLGFRPAKPLR